MCSTKNRILCGTCQSGDAESRARPKTNTVLVASVALLLPRRRRSGKVGTRASARVRLHCEHYECPKDSAENSTHAMSKPASKFHQPTAAAVVSCALSCLLSCFTMEAVAQEKASVKDLEKELYRAVQRDETAVAIERLNELAAMGDVKAYRAIIKYGLTGTNYEIERQAGRLLVDTDSPKVIVMTLDEAGSNRNYRTRIILLAVVSRWAVVERESGGDRQPTKLNALALEVLHAAIGDRSRPVALSAVKWISE